jgi:precorrin-6B methylase 2
MMSESDLQQIVESESEFSYPSFIYHVQQRLGGANLYGKRFLELGCGRGHICLYAILCGAKKVVAVDESSGHGAEAGILDALRQHKKRFGLPNLHVIQTDAKVWRPALGEFDICFANNAMHHASDK